VPVDIVEVTPSTLIAAVGTAAHGEIPKVMIGLLDQVWPYIRGNGIAPDHNVVIYRDEGTHLTAGVRVPDDTPEPPAPLVRATTPGGRAAHLRHVGPYSAIPSSVQELFASCAEQGLEVAEPMWEVYGDHTDDESKLVTDLYVSLA
jgi:effector-binding domain-containing protein